eukprot:scaffold16428_cov108-Isochrysis_galbana.AAC.3
MLLLAGCATLTKTRDRVVGRAQTRSAAVPHAKALVVLNPSISGIPQRIRVGTMWASSQQTGQALHKLHRAPHRVALGSREASWAGAHR